MQELADRALNAAQLAGATYADVRVVESRSQLVEVKNRRPSALQEGAGLGLGVRALVDGAWGFAASATPDAAEAERCAALACRTARASARFRLRPIVLSPLAPRRASYQTPFVRDPFEVPLADKIDLLIRATGAMQAEKSIAVAQGTFRCWEERKLFASSEGARIEQRILHSGAGLCAYARGGDDLQWRSYPNSFGGQYEAAGWELVERLDLDGHAAETAATAAALLTAPQCPAGATTVILDGAQMSLQIHESCGHPAELDRVLGHEANFAGTSFLTPDQLGTLRYGSPVVNLVADATAERGLGTFGFDDEGVPAQKVDLVREGRFVGYLTSRETAPLIGQTSNGTMRAESWGHIPLIRMTNINLEPGPWTLESLIADTEEGILMATNRSWSIDDRRYNFQFGTEVGWEIRKGRRGRLLKNCTYTGITPQFWNQCDAVCDDWEIWGTPNCGKGQPTQGMRTAQGASSARFRQIQAGVGYGALSPVTAGARDTGQAPMAREEARGLLSEALAMSAADQTTAVLEARDESLTRFANNEIHQNVTARRQTLVLQSVVGRRRGIASTTRFDSSALRQVADRALALARLSPEDDRMPAPAPPAEALALEGFAAATAACAPEERAAAVGAVAQAAAERDLNAAGALTTASGMRAVASTLGVFAYHADTYARFTCTARAADASGWVDRHRHDWRDLDVPSLGATAMRKAEQSREPDEVAPGRYTVVLEPAAVAELVAFLGWLGLGAQCEQEGRSFLSGRMGERITGAGVTLVDDAFDRRSFGTPFDYEGTPKRRVTLIEDGFARAVVHDRRTALAAGVASTGHATAPPAIDGPLPYDLVLANGSSSLDELIASTERGILVTRFWYNRVVDARRTLVTGMTRDGTFLIEGGRLARGLRNLRFNESVLEVLARAEAAGRDAEPTLFDYTGNCVVAPALKVREFQFTGVTRF